MTCFRVTILNVLHITGSQSPGPDIEVSSVPFPRAVSEPPPDFSDTSPSLLPLPDHYDARLRASTVRPHPSRNLSTTHPNHLTLRMPDIRGETEEYSWEWGNFPQKTPVWNAFEDAEKARKGKGRQRDEEYWGATNGRALSDAGRFEFPRTRLTYS